MANSTQSAVSSLHRDCFGTQPLETSRGSLPKYKGLIDASRKCIRGNGTKFIVISFKSKLRDPSNRIELVKLFSRWATKEFILSKGRSVPTDRGLLRLQQTSLLHQLDPAKAMLSATPWPVTGRSRCWSFTKHRCFHDRFELPGSRRNYGYRNAASVM